MVRFSDKFKAAGLTLALLMPAAMLPVAAHAQQTDTAPAKTKSKKHGRKNSASQAEGTTQRTPQAGSPDPINPSGSPEPPTPTTQGPPPPPTTPKTNTPQNAPPVAPH